MTSESTAHEYWRMVFDAPIDLFDSPEIAVLPHSKKMRGRNSAWIFAHSESCLVSLPDRLLPAAANRIKSSTTHAMFSGQSLDSLFGDKISRMVGPSSQFYLDKYVFIPSVIRPTRQLAEGDKGEVGKFLDHCDSNDVDDSGIDFSREPLFGSFHDDSLVAVASGIEWTESIQNIGILVQNDFRKLHYGLSAASCAMEWILGNSKTVFYQTLTNNKGSVSIAERLGCKLFGRMLYIEFE